MSSLGKPEFSVENLDEILDNAGPEEFKRLEKKFEEARRRPPRARLIAEGDDDPPEVGKKILVIGDAHAEPRQSLRRFKWLGRMVADHNPDYLVSIGDFGSLDSLGQFDRPGSAAFRAETYWDDIESINTALAILDEFADGTPALRIAIEGNHEARIQKHIDADTRVGSLMDYAHMYFVERGWEWNPYLRPRELCGFQFVHELRSRKGMKTGSKFPAQWCFNEHEGSWVWGHTHERHIGQRGNRVNINVGCYFEHQMGYSNIANQYYDRGIMLLNNAGGGNADYEWWSMERIRSRYSDG